MSLMYTAEERADRLTDAEKERKARRLSWTGVVYLFVAAVLAPLYLGPAMGIMGAGIVNLGIALHYRNQRKTGARILLGVGAATAIAGIILTVIELIRFFQR